MPRDVCGPLCRAVQDEVESIGRAADLARYAQTRGKHRPDMR
jgi:hypothetical protein